jgi:hypothetical protein
MSGGVARVANGKKGSKTPGIQDYFRPANPTSSAASADSNSTTSTTIASRAELNQPEERKRTHFNPDVTYPDPATRPWNWKVSPDQRASFRRVQIKSRMRTILPTYPKTKDRSFLPAWFNVYEWLEYSESADKAYCFPCSLFAKEQIGGSKGGSDVVVDGFSTWKNGPALFASHIGEIGSNHLACVSMMTEFLQQDRHIPAQLDAATVAPKLSISELDSDESFVELWKVSVLFCEQHKIEVPLMNTQYKPIGRSRRNLKVETNEEHFRDILNQIIATKR